MNNLDDQIRDALQAEQEDLFDDDDDLQAHFESLKFMFRGKTKWITIFHFSVMIVFLTMIVISSIQFFRVESIRAMIAWATGFAVCLILQGLAELYFMMEVNKHVIRWEVKQLELQVASLAGKMRTQESQRES
ncbi:MAG: hypothetical protein H8E66_34380 [Planctomycetes bacterium]|nr:hypothetical protein [Planctomycetota bacterium]